MDKELKNRLIGIAVAKGSWYAAQKYLLETGNFSDGAAYIAVRALEKDNPEINLPGGGYYIDRELENRLLGIAAIKGGWNAAQKYLEGIRNIAESSARIAVSRIEERNPDIELPWEDTTWTKN